MKLKYMILAPLAIALSACGQVDAGHRGVFVEWGQPTSQVGEGLHYYNPWSTDLILVDVRQTKWDSTTVAYTKDVQQADVAFTVTYSLEPSKALYVYRNVGEGWQKAIIPQVVEQAIKDVFGQSEAVKDTINNRSAVQQKILNELKIRLRARNVEIHGFELRDISFSDAFEKAVEQKQVAVENANAARNRTVQVQEEAKQKVIAAEADAKAMQIKTQALQNSPTLVEYERVQKDKMAVQKWNGVLPIQMIPGSSVPFINLSDK